MRRLALAVLLAACDGVVTQPAGFEGDFQPIGQPPVDAARDAARPDPDDGVPAPDAGVTTKPLSLRFTPIEQDSGALRATDIAFLPDPPGDFLVLDKDGHVEHLRLQPDGSAKRVGGFDLPDTWDDSDAGLVSIAVDPLFATNRFIYLGVSTSMQTNQIRRYRFDPADYAKTAASGVLVIEVTGERAERSWHNVGSIGFTKEGHLWALFGDKTLDGVAQDVNLPLGALLRIDPDRDDDGGYDIPADNPYADGSGHPAVWAKGFRSPWKGFYDPTDDTVWVGDVGLDTWEELDHVTGPGLNFGWSTIEGPCGDHCGEVEGPWLAYTHATGHPFVADDPQATTSRLRAIWVGGRHVGGPDPYAGRWDRVVVFGDAFSGFVRAAPLDRPGESYPVGHAHFVTGMAQGPDGYMYAVALGTWPVDAPMTFSPIYRVEPGD
jgi:glucose/arabinose dehydrogenase